MYFVFVGGAYELEQLLMSLKFGRSFPGIFYRAFITAFISEISYKREREKRRKKGDYVHVVYSQKEGSGGGGPFFLLKLLGPRVTRCSSEFA